jgi:hypothetical protein
MDKIGYSLAEQAQKLVNRWRSMRENWLVTRWLFRENHSRAARAFSEFFLYSPCHLFLCPLFTSLSNVLCSMPQVSALSPVLCSLSHASVPCFLSSVPCLTSLFLASCPLAPSLTSLSLVSRPLSPVSRLCSLPPVRWPPVSPLCPLSPVLCPLSHVSFPFPCLLSAVPQSCLSIPCFSSAVPSLCLCSLSPILCPLSHVSIPCLPSFVPCLRWSVPCLPSSFFPPINCPSVLFSVALFHCSCPFVPLFLLLPSSVPCLSHLRECGELFLCKIHAYTVLEIGALDGW